MEQSVLFRGHLQTLMALARSLGAFNLLSSRLPLPLVKTFSSGQRDDYFHLFDLQRSYDIDHKHLKKQYISLQSKLHPDKFAGADEKEVQFAQYESSHVSRAYEIMRDDYKRGQHLLTLLSGENSSEGDDEQMDVTFLEEMMNLGEKVQSSRSEGRDELLKSLDDQLVQLNRQVSAAFTCQEWRKCRQLLSKMKFYQSLKSSLVDKM